tara:strand:+ start:19852 stop:20379 length:528 start_codon:yes stop_codon:yes gene_type:complete
MKAIAIGGVPATGKTTLVKAMLNILKPNQKLKYGLLRGLVKDDTAVLGVYENGETFSGTDRLSMAVQTHYDSYINRQLTNVVFEGDRLFTANNLISLLETFDTKIVILEADPQTLSERHKSRGDTQTEVFLRGRETKINNIKLNPKIQKNFETYVLRTEDKTIALAAELISWLGH